MALFFNGYVRLGTISFSPLFEMFSYGFMQRAFLAILLMSVLAPMLGVFLVLRRQSLMADTLSHVSLAGVALGLFVNWNPTVATLLVVVISAFIIEYLSRLYRTYSEVSIAILMSAGLALALVLMSLNPDSSAASIQQYLFGSIVTIDVGQVKVLAVLFILVLILFILFRRPMYVLTFDEDTAFAEGLPISWMSLCFNVLTGVSIAVMMPIAGALLISAVMILPAAIAMRLAKSFKGVIIVSIIAGLLGMLGGLVTSYQVNTPPGATITLIFIAIFVVSSIGKKIYLRRKLTVK